MELIVDNSPERPHADDHKKVFVALPPSEVQAHQSKLVEDFFKEIEKRNQVESEDSLMKGLHKTQNPSSVKFRDVKKRFLTKLAPFMTLKEQEKLLGPAR